MPHREQELLLSTVEGERGVDRIALLHLVSSLELLHPLCGVYDSPLSGEERVTLAAKLHLEHRPGRTNSEAIATGAGDLRFHILRMYTLLHQR